MYADFCKNNKIYLFKEYTTYVFHYLCNIIRGFQQTPPKKVKNTSKRLT